MEILGKLSDIRGIVIGWLVRLAVIAFLILAGKHYDENPVVIVIIFIIGLVILIGSISETLILSSSGLIVRTTFLGVWTKDEIIEYAKIESINYTGDYTLSREIFFTLMPGSSSANPNLIIIKLKDGSVKEFTFHLFKDKIMDFVTLGKGLIK